MNNKDKKNLRNLHIAHCFTNDELSLLVKLSFHSACMYNVASYNIKQAWFNDNKNKLTWSENYHKVKHNEHFSILMNDNAQHMCKKAHHDFSSFLGLLKLKKKGEYQEKVNIPKYKKKNGETTLSEIIIQGRGARLRKTLNKSNVWRINTSKKFKELYPSLPTFIEFKVPKHITKINEIKISPKYNGKQFDINIVYEISKNPPLLEDNGKYLTIDTGLNNLLTCVNSSNGESFIIDGKKLKAINHYFNKQIAKFKSKLDTTTNEQYKIQLQNKLNLLSEKRHHKINAYYHLVTKHLVNYCQKNNINTVVIGENKQQKQNINIGKINNQNFVNIPLFKLKNILEYKLNQQGITLVRQEESYTSKTSFLDLEEVTKQDIYQGKRVKRGLFKSLNNIFINADVNGALNILRKYLTRKGKIKIWLKSYFNEVYKGIVNYPQKLTHLGLLNEMTSNKKNLLL